MERAIASLRDQTESGAEVAKSTHTAGEEAYRPFETRPRRSVRAIMHACLRQRRDVRS
jgi:hypothetical protein